MVECRIARVNLCGSLPCVGALSTWFLPKELRVLYCGPWIVFAEKRLGGCTEAANVKVLEWVERGIVRRRIPIPARVRDSRGLRKDSQVVVCYGAVPSSVFVALLDVGELEKMLMSQIRT